MPQYKSAVTKDRFVDWSEPMHHKNLISCTQRDLFTMYPMITQKLIKYAQKMAKENQGGFSSKRKREENEEELSEVSCEEKKLKPGFESGTRSKDDHVVITDNNRVILVIRKFACPKPGYLEFSSQTNGTVNFDFNIDNYEESDQCCMHNILQLPHFHEGVDWFNKKTSIYKFNIVLPEDTDKDSVSIINHAQYFIWVFKRSPKVRGGKIILPCGEN
ncbi:hypothetical protein DLAC_11012 [Tieghemostelium lacteum]|uniref:Uncharacterized protein n=1 Tax=Tieghemostelium lacteum TaxID=361077 RepID=A0A151Z2Y1_TIELA|nr:hypothetical protein DLAC_11012 [Tieghemostelium lacteum]|eukprot:KYQ88316.1 hypothetical protein DLAC_11012 [Tieghemostelium lacteum]